MAFLYVSEYKGVGIGVAAAAGAHLIQAPIVPALNEYRLAIGSTLVISTGFGLDTRLVSLHPDADCHVNLAAAPSTVANAGRMGAGTERFFAVTPGHKVSVIAST